MRLFIAINLPSDLKTIIGQRKSQLVPLVNKNLAGRITWVRPEIYHLTIKFCGDIQSMNYDKISKIVASTVNNFNSFKICLTNLQLWPKKNPRLLKLAIKPNTVLNELTIALSAKLDASGLLDPKLAGSKPPHLTIARLAGHWSGEYSLENINETFFVSQLDIMSSDLTPTGPNYTLLDSFKLKP